MGVGCVPGMLVEGIWGHDACIDMRIDWNHLEVRPFLNNKKTLLKKDTLVKSFEGKEKKKISQWYFQDS